MTPILLVMAIVVVALVLFAIERIPLEVTSLTVVCLLAASGVLTPAEAFAGFSNETVIVIFALLAMTEGLASSGVIQKLGGGLVRLRHLGPRGFLLGLMLLVALCSALVSNTVTTAAFLPATIHAARAAGVRRSVVLLPLAFASMLGGMGFLYGTSTNLVVSAQMQALGLGGIGLVELSPAGIPLALLGIVLVVALAPRLLRPRAATGPGEVRRDFVTEVQVLDTGRIAGRPLSWLSARLALQPIAVVRQARTLAPAPELVLRPRDRLLLKGPRSEVMRIRQLGGLVLSHGPELASWRERSQWVVTEAVLPVTSALIGTTLADARFTSRHGAWVLGLYRHPSIQLHQDPVKDASFRRVVLHEGDSLLLAGPAQRLRELGEDPSLLLLLNQENLVSARRGKAVLAAALFAGALVTGSMGLIPLSVATLAGLLLMIATGCLDPKLAFRIDWKVVLLIGSMMALGVAMEKTGAGALLGGWAAGVAGLGGPRLVLVALMAVTVLLSVPMSNQAAALVMLPVALGAAGVLGVEPRGFAMGIALAASCSFITPLEPSAMLVFGPGRYRFTDFLKVGGPVTVVLLGALALLVPLIWPF